VSYPRLIILIVVLTSSCRFEYDPLETPAPEVDDSLPGADLDLMWQSGVQISDSTSSAQFPSVVWTGSEFAFAWTDSRDGNEEIYFARADDDANKIGSDVRVTNAIYRSLAPALVWMGDQYGVFWSDHRHSSGENTLHSELYFDRISASGDILLDDLRLTNAPLHSKSPTAVRIADGFGVVWEDIRDGNEELYFSRIDYGKELPTWYAQGSSWARSTCPQALQQCNAIRL